MITRKSIFIAADLETTKATKNKNAQVYAWAFCVLTKYDRKDLRHRYLFDNILIKKLISKKLIAKKIINELTYYYGIRLKNFVQILLTISTNSFLLFQNGNHFDLHFVVDELQKQNIVKVLPFLNKDLKHQQDFSNFQLYNEWYQDNIKERNQKYLKQIFDDNLIPFKNKERRLNRLNEKEFMALEVDHNFFQLKICIKKDSKHKNRKIYLTVLDAYLQFKASLLTKGQELNLPKLEIEYDKLELYNDISDFEQDGNQLPYLLRDVEILYYHTLKMYSFIGFSNVKITAAAIAYRQFIIFFVKKHLNKLEQQKQIKYLGFRKIKQKQHVCLWQIIDSQLQDIFNSKYLTKKSLFNYLLKTELVENTLNNEEREHLQNHYYRGGICHVNEKYRGVITPAIGYDINSSYPNVMQSNELCPIGPQLKINVNVFNRQYYCFIKLQSLTDVYLKEFMPFLRNTENRSESVTAFVNNQYKYHTFYYKYSYCKQINRTDIYYLSSTELWHLCDILKITTEKQLQKYFVFKTEYVFKATTFSYYFKDFINFWYKIKKTKPNQKSIAKLILNSCYGKFAQRKINVLKFDYQLENGDIKILTKIYRELNAYYLPLGIAIPAQARINLCKVVDYNYDNFVYADTDSAYFIKPNKSLPLSNKIGDWKKEANFTHFLVRRGKQYIGINVSKGIGKIAISGFKIPLEYNYYNIKSDNIEKNNFIFITQIMGFENFLKGFKFYNQLTSKRFKGGMNILKVTKELPATWSHKLHISNEQVKLIKEHYLVDLMNARVLDNQLKQSYQNNYLKTEFDLNYLDKLNFENLIKH